MAKKKPLKLTERQHGMLARLSDTQWTFPGSLEEMSYRKMESMGLAESELLCAAITTRGSSFRRAFRRTEKGREFVQCSEH